MKNALNVHIAFTYRSTAMFSGSAIHRFFPYVRPGNFAYHDPFAAGTVLFPKRSAFLKEDAVL